MTNSQTLSPSARAEDILRSKRLKVTPQRLLLLSLIQEQGHVSVEELYDQMSKVYSSLSLATIYKNVNALMREGVLGELALAGEKPRYEIARSDHAHFVCELCGSAHDVTTELERVRDFFAEEVGGVLSGCDVVLKGTCNDCLNC